MKTRTALLIVALLVAGSATFVAQELSKTGNTQKEQPAEPQEAYMRRSEGDVTRKRLTDTSLVALDVASSDVERSGDAAIPDAADKQRDNKKSGSHISFKLRMTNLSPDPLYVIQADRYSEFRPELSKKGVMVPYSDRVTKLLEKKAKEPYPSYYGVTTITLDSGETKPIANFDLSDWYDPLPPGEYQQIVKYRPHSGAEWTQFPSVNFEVAP